MKIGFITAFPPGRNSLNEYGLHFCRALAANPHVNEIVLFGDRIDGPEAVQIPHVRIERVWEFNKLTNLAAMVKQVRRSGVDAVVFNLQFATFGDTKIAGGLGLLAPAVIKAIGIPTGVILHNIVEKVDMRDAGLADSWLMSKLMTAAGTALTKIILRADYVALTIPRYVELVRHRYGVTNAVLIEHLARASRAQLEGGTLSDVQVAS